MERQDDKLIAGKLDSLDYLPEGYSPNLQSKWALLEGALNQPVYPRRKKAAIWLSIAAGFFLLMGVTTLWMYMHRQGTVTPSQTKTIVLQNIAPIPLTENKNVEPFTLSQQKRFAKKTKIEVQPEPVNVPVVVAENGPVNPILVQQVENNPGITKAVTAVVPITKKAKGPRYVQVDFDTPAGPMPLSKGGFAQSFQLRLFRPVSNSTAAAQSFQNTASIKF